MTQISLEKSVLGVHNKPRSRQIFMASVYFKFVLMITNKY